jgi:hypothetical protein
MIRSPQLQSKRDWNQLMSELKSEPDSIGGKNQKINHYVYISSLNIKCNKLQKK